MILVYGSDPSFVDEVVTHLTRGRQRALGVPIHAHLFTEAVEKRANAVIGLEAEKPSPEERRELVEALIAASVAPSAPRIVLVTSAPLDGPEVKALKRSGASYILISSLGLSTPSPPSRSEFRTVWLSQRLLGREHAVVTKPALLCTIARAVAEDTATGIELSPHSETWREALEAAGVRVRVVPNWLARVAYFFGAPALYLATGKAVVRLDDRESVSAIRALPSTTSI